MMSSTQISPNDHLTLEYRTNFFFNKSGVTNEPNQRPSYTLKLIQDDDGRTVARCTNLQGVVTDGIDENEAIKNAIEAIDAVLEMTNDSKEYNINVQ